ncbi:RelA/SpoT domain-containing protein, partial [Vibrio splendidus]
MPKLDLDSFLEQSNLTKKTWEKSNTQIIELDEIAAEFEKLKPRLEQVATGIVGMLQKHNSVHSVRWRVKDTNHLLAKIVRKRAEGKTKYIELTKDTYSDVITDLVGVRVLHLFKADWSNIQQYLDEFWNIVEGPTAYIRKGDDRTPFIEYGVNNDEIIEHKDDYRSIHNIIESNLVKQPTRIEVQIRTIYEEAWSEIDHKVRYPNYSNNQQLKFFLKILNGLSGNADEMGSFVNVLASQIKSFEKMEAQMLAHKDALDNANKVKQEQLDQIRQLALQNEEIQAALDKIKEADSDITVLERSNQATAPVKLSTYESPRSTTGLAWNTMDSISKAASLGLSGSTLDSISRAASIGLSNSTLDSISRAASLGLSNSTLDSISRATSLGLSG